MGIMLNTGTDLEQAVAAAAAHVEHSVAQVSSS